MVPSQEHAFYMWLIIIGAVCIATFIGAMIDRFFLYRRLRQQKQPVRREIHTIHHSSGND